MDKYNRVFVPILIVVIFFNMVVYITLPGEISPIFTFKISLIGFIPIAIMLIYDILDAIFEGSSLIKLKIPSAILLVVAIFFWYASWIDPNINIINAISNIISFSLISAVVVFIVIALVLTILKIADEIAESKEYLKKAGKWTFISILIAMFICTQIIIGFMLSPATFLSIPIGIWFGFSVNKYNLFFHAVKSIALMSLFWGISGVIIECITGFKRIATIADNIFTIRRKLILLLVSEAVSSFLWGVATFLLRKYFFS